MTFSDLARMKAIRSERTAELYAVAIKSWCNANGFSSPEEGIAKIKSQKEPVKAAIETINKFIFTLSDKKRAPKTIVGYVSATKKFLAFEDVPISKEVFDAKVVLPQMYETSIDTIPTDDQMRQILLNANTVKAKALITLLGSSGLRINEACNLKVGHIQFDKSPVKVVLPAKQTKTRKSRETFISDEGASFLKQYLGERIKDPNVYVFEGEKGGPAYKGGLIDLVERAIAKAGLRFKLEDESARYALHTHSFRKLFFSKSIGAGLDRGIVEAWMGHKFGLDGAYLRLSDEQKGAMYQRVMPSLTFLSPTANNGRIKSMTEEMAAQQERIKELEKTTAAAMDLLSRLTSELTYRGTMKEIESVKTLYAPGVRVEIQGPQGRRVIEDVARLSPEQLAKIEQAKQRKTAKQK